MERVKPETKEELQNVNTKILKEQISYERKRR